MKRLFSMFTVTTAAVLLSVAAIQAQDAPAGDGPRRERPRGEGRGFDPEQRVNRMAETLGLNDEQKGKLKEVFAKQREKGREETRKIREDSSLSEEQKREKLQALFKANQDEINAVLTPEQQAKWKEQSEQARERFRGRGEGRGGDGERPRRRGNREGGDKKAE